MAIIRRLITIRANVGLAAFVITRHHIVTGATTDIAITLLDWFSAVVASAIGRFIGIHVMRGVGAERLSAGTAVAAASVGSRVEVEA